MKNHSFIILVALAGSAAFANAAQRPRLFRSEVPTSPAKTVQSQRIMRKSPRHYTELPAVRRVPHADARRHAQLSGQRGIIIQSSGNVGDTQPSTSYLDSALVQEMQVPVVPAAAPVAVVPAPALAVTAAPVVAAPVAGATVAPAAPVAGAVAVTPAPASGGGGTLLILFALAALVLAAAVIIVRLRSRNQQSGGRLGGVQENAAGAGVDSQFWKSAKTRQSYRQTALAKSSGSKGNVSTSEDEG